MAIYVANSTVIALKMVFEAIFHIIIMVEMMMMETLLLF